MRSLLHRLRNWFGGLGGGQDGGPPDALGWIWAVCLVGVASCAGLSKPMLGPDGQPKTNPDGSEVTVYDEAVSTTGTLGSLLLGNPLWGTLIGAAGLLLKDKVVKKSPPAPVPPPIA